MAVAVCAACGGGSADGSESTTVPGVEGETSASRSSGGPGSDSGAASPNATAEEEPKKHVSPAREEAEERAAYEKKRYGHPSHRSASFRRSSREGVLKHLPEYGSEAVGGERGQVQAVLAGYLAAAGADDWKQACKYLLPYYIAQLEASARAAADAPRDCAEILPTLFESAAEDPGSEFPDTQAPQVASLRVTAYPPGRAAELNLDVEKAGFALLHGSDGVDYYLSMTREGGEWKLTTPMPHPLSN